MADRSLPDLVSRLRVDTTGLVKAEGEAAAFTGRMALLFAGIVGVVGAVGVVSLKMASDFQNSTVGMQNNAGITAEAAKKIGDAFLGTAGKTVFSAEAMMTAFGPVAGQFRLLYGHALSSAEALKVMDASMNLAEATGDNLATTTATLTNVMTAYKLPVAAAAKTSDELFNASRAVNVPVDALATGILRLHGRLGDVAPSFADTAALMLTLAQQGLTGSRAMLILNTGLTTLLGGSKATKDELHKLGVSVYDASGNFVGMDAVIAQVGPKLAGMTEQQRRLAATALFGSGAEGVLTQVMESGVAKFDLNRAAIEKNNTAKQAAAAQAATLNGQIRTVTAAFSDFAVMIGEEVMPYVAQFSSWVIENLPQIRAFVSDGLNKVKQAFQDIKPFLQDVVRVLGFLANNMNIVRPIAIGLTAIFLAFQAAMGISALLEFGAAFLTFAAEQGIAAAAATALGVAELLALWPIALLVLGIAALIAIIILAVTHTKEIGQAFSWLGTRAKEVWGVIVTDVAEFVTMIHGHMTDLWNRIKATWDSLVKTAEAAWSDFTSRPIFWLTFLVASAVKFMFDLKAKIDQKFGELIIAAWNAGVNFQKNFLTFISELPSKVLFFLVDLLIRVGQWEIQMIQKARAIGSGFVNAEIAEMRALPGQIVNLFEEVLRTLVSLIPRLIQAGRDLGNALVNAEMDQIRRLPGMVGNVISNIGSQVRSGLHAAGVPGFALGGRVPGAVGAASLAIVHGGETILRAGETTASGGTGSGSSDALLGSINRHLADLAASANDSLLASIDRHLAELAGRQPLNATVAARRAG